MQATLPAAGWGEMPGTRWNGERRLRLSDRFMDPPGEARPDWWVIAQVAQRLGFEGYDWADENEIFVAAAGLPSDYDVTALGDELQDESANHTSHEAVVIAAELQGKTAYDIMRELGTNGVQLPARLDAEGNVIGTPRIHGAGEFDTVSGKAMFLNVGWDTAEAIWDRLKPDPALGEFWLTNGRIEEIWQTMYTDLRKPEVYGRWPSNIVEINPEDAEANGIVSGDLISLSSDRIARNQAGEYDTGSLTAAAYVSDIVPPGVLWTNFAYPDQWCNNTAPRFMHPVNPVTPFKLARAKLNGQFIGIPNEEHRTFHLTMFQRLDNPFVLGLLEAYWDAYETVEPNRYADYAYHQSVWDYHERILDAIVAGDFEAAKTLFIEHTRLLRHQPPTAINSPLNPPLNSHDHDPVENGATFSKGARTTP